MMDRRTFLVTLAAASLLGRAGAAELPEPTAKALPRWRGFNLLEKFMVGNQQPFREADFALIAELGFNFARLPLDYRCWIEGDDPARFRESTLKEIDRAVAWGRQYGVHTQLNYHRAPGYTVASPREAKDLWTDQAIQATCANHWATFAERYKDIPSRHLSFNLFNEPAEVSAEAHKRVVARMVEAIHAKDAGRLIVCDGRRWGTEPPTELVGLGVAAATRGYAPFHLTHYKASWVEGSDAWETPKYPFAENGETWGPETIGRDQIQPWKALQAQGVGVMVGEFGCHNRTPHPVVLAWARDSLAAWKGAGWGWALWNLRGSFGILDSDRPDVTYEDFRGHKLDRALLDVLNAG